MTVAMIVICWLLSNIVSMLFGYGIRYIPWSKKTEYSPVAGDLVEWKEAGFLHRAEFVRWTQDWDGRLDKWEVKHPTQGLRLVLTTEHPRVVEPEEEIVKKDPLTYRG